MAEELEDLKEGRETEAEKKDKISKKHAEAMKFVTAIFGGEEQLKPKKTLRGDTTARVVATLFQQEQEEFEKKALEELRALLKKYFDFTTEVKKKKDELDKLELQKKKEFTEAVNNVKKSFNQQEIMAEGYVGALKEATQTLAASERK